MANDKIQIRLSGIGVLYHSWEAGIYIADFIDFYPPYLTKRGLHHSKDLFLLKPSKTSLNEHQRAPLSYPELLVTSHHPQPITFSGSYQHWISEALF
jgi:hypothetical protein